MKKLFYLFILTLSFASCVKDTDYDTPQIACEEPVFPSEQVTSIQNVLNIWNAANPTGTTMEMAKFAEESALPVYVSGYVTSSDKTGNFYKELYIQDAPDNPQYAVKIAIDISSLYTKYPMGSKIFIKLNGLAINKSHGELVIGSINVGDIDVISENHAKLIIKRSCTISKIIPKSITTAQISNSLVGMYVKLDNMEFDLPVVGKSFVNPLDSYDSHRVMISCDTEDELKLETSTFASFKDQTVPSGKGSVSGILTKDYGDDFYVLRVNDPSVFSFTGERCGPTMLNCNNSNAGTGTTILFEQNFESLTVNSTTIPGWTNVNISGGSTLYAVKTFNSNKYMQYSAYNNGEASSDVWLITPAINIDNTTNEALSFKTATGYNNGAALSVYVSTDYTGNVNTATWKLANATLANGPSSGYQSTFTDSGTVDISCLTGNVYVAFRYKGGSVSGVTTTFQIDNVKVTGQTP